MEAVTLRRYLLPSIKGEGWALFVLGSDGFFSVVSDRGNYAHYWPGHGCKDFREFFLKVESEWDYFVKKLAPTKVYDGDASQIAVQQAICEARRKKRITKRCARDAFEEAEEIYYGPEAFAIWENDHSEILEEPWVYRRFAYSSDAEQFVKLYMSRLAGVLRTELTEEGYFNG